MAKRIGIVTGGGDCPGLNAAIRAIVKAAALRGWESMGILGGFEGLLAPVRARPLDYREMGGLLYRGGTILGASNTGRFTAKTGHGDVRRVPADVVAEAKRSFEMLGLHALVCIGGDGSLTIAHQLLEAGIPVVGLPKTIDNDVQGTLTTFGFDSAVTCAVDALDRLHSTAESHNRVMVLEVMGRYAGWIAATAGLAGGADVILIPEIPFTYDAIFRKVKQRESMGKLFTVVIVAEGARSRGGDYVTVSGGASAARETRLGGIGPLVASEIERGTGKETRCVVLGHLQRGGPPTAVDRQLCTRFGAYAVRMVAEGRFGEMAALTPAGVAPVRLADAIAGIRRVPADSELVEAARSLGVSFGDD